MRGYKSLLEGGLGWVTGTLRNGVKLLEFASKLSWRSPEFVEKRFREVSCAGVRPWELAGK